ncbi:MAG: (4Fe-4S)-binding protein [Candidatus Nanopelagicales bacterium]
MTTRDYPTAGLTIHWDSEVCIHSGVCASTLPAVFRPRERPWIDADAASADEIAATIDRCPSGALRYTRDGEQAAEPAAVAAVEVDRTTITVHARGPLEVRGEMSVVASDGTVLRESRRQYFCRCGHSANKPFCDGSHNRVRFDDEGLGARDA